jgi:hypothetical protein
MRRRHIALKTVYGEIGFAHVASVMESLELQVKELGFVFRNKRADRLADLVRRSLNDEAAFGNFANKQAILNQLIESASNGPGESRSCSTSSVLVKNLSPWSKSRSMTVRSA